MTQRFDKPAPLILSAPPPDGTLGAGALVVRVPKGPAEERTLGVRAALVVGPTPPEEEGRQRRRSAAAAANATAERRESALKRATAVANAALDYFDRDASASPHERARRAINAAISSLGGAPLTPEEVKAAGGTAATRSDGIVVAMFGIGRDAAWAARTGGATIVANIGDAEHRSTIRLPEEAPGSSAGSLLRQGVAAARIAVREGDTFAFGIDEEETLRLFGDSSITSDQGEGQPHGLLVGLRLPHRAEHPSAARVGKSSTPAEKSDPLSLAKAQSRARWEEVRADREEQIAATIAPKPASDGRRPVSNFAPYEPIDVAAREAIAAREAGVRVAPDPRGRSGRAPKASRSERSAAREAAAREAARNRANRTPGAEPRIERSWAERRAAASPTGLNLLVARVVGRITGFLERRFPHLVEAPARATMRTRGSNEITEQERARRTRRRTATLFLGSILLAAAAGGGALLLNRAEPNLDAAARARAAIERATQNIDEALDPAAQLVLNDPARAKKLLIDALTALRDADAAKINPSIVAALTARATPSLDRLLLIYKAQVFDIADFSKATTPIELTGIIQGPDNLPYVIDGKSGAVYQVDTTNGKARAIYQPGYDLGTARTARAQLIASAGIDIIIFDASSNLWRWRRADNSGRGSLVKVRVRDGQQWGTDVRAIVGFFANEGTGLYRLYVVDPSSRQVLRYEPAPDGTGYPAAPTGYFITPTNLADVDGIVIDGDLYLTQGGTLRRYAGGALDDWTPADLGDAVLRPAPHYTVIASLGENRSGIIYALDTAGARVIAFSKGTGGAVLGQYQLSADQPVGTMLGAYVVPAADGGAPTLVWAEAQRIRSAVLGATVEPGATASPGGSGSPIPPSIPPVIDLPTIAPAP